MRESGVFHLASAYNFTEHFLHKLISNFKCQLEDVGRCTNFIIWFEGTWFLSFICPFFIDKTSCYFEGKQFKGCKICDEIKYRATVYKMKKILIKLFLSSEIFSVSDALHLMKFFSDKLSISLSFYIQFHKFLRRTPDHTVHFVN